MINNQPGPHIQVEYDLNFAGGNYDKVGEFAYIPCQVVEQVGSVEKAFEQVTGHDAIHIIHYCPDEHYTADGEFWDD